MQIHSRIQRCFKLPRLNLTHTIIEDKTDGKIPFKYARIMTDLVCGITGLVTGMIGNITTAGLATLFIVFGTGPIVDWYRKNITCKWTA